MGSNPIPSATFLRCTRASHEEMRNYFISTIGCQMNKADSERLESALGQIGLSAADSAKNADVVVLNSCVVRQSAEDKIVGMLTSLKPTKERDPDKVYEYRV